MADVCTDGRFEMIERVKQRLVKATNIEARPEEMDVLDSILFRFWQQGWLKLIDDTDTNTSIRDELRYCIDYINPRHPLLDNGNLNVRHYRTMNEETANSVLTIILSCGCKIKELYRGNVFKGKLAEWETPMIVDPEDWFTEEWLKVVTFKNISVDFSDVKIEFVDNYEEIQNKLKALNQGGKVYVVTRSEEHCDYVEKVFIDETKAQEYCDKFNKDEDEYHRDITEIMVEV